MKKTSILLLVAALTSDWAHAQLYRYAPVVIDDQGTCRIEQIDIVTGIVHTLIDSVGRVVQIVANEETPFLFLQIRGRLEVRSLASPEVAHILLDPVEWVHEILDVPATMRTFVSVGTVDSCEWTIIYDRNSWVPLDTILNFWSYQPPFLSTDGTNVYRLLPDERAIRFLTYDGTSGQQSLPVALAGPTGFAYQPVFCDGRLGKALLSYEVKPGGFGFQRMIVCDLDSRTCDHWFPVEFRSIGRLSPDGDIVIVEEVQWDSTRPSSEFHSGKIRTHEASNGRLLREMLLPPGGQVIVGGTRPVIGYYSLGGGVASLPILSSSLPEIQYLSPEMTLTRSGSFPLVVKGTGFVQGAEILWNGSPRPTTYVSSTELNVRIPGADIATPRDVPVSMRNPDGARSDSLIFSAVDTLPAPVTPMLECVTRERSGGFTAWFGYKNDNTRSVYIPPGRMNNFTPVPKNRSQATVFQPGRKTRVFGVAFPGDNLRWMLNDRIITASKNSSRCR